MAAADAAKAAGDKALLVKDAESAKGEIDKVAEAKKNEIEKANQGTKAEKESAKVEIDSKAEEAKKAIDKAETKNNINTAKNNGIDAINKVSLKEATPEEKKQATDDINKAAEAKKSAIDKAKGVPDSEKEIQKAKVDAEANIAKNDIEKAYTKGDVEQAKNTGIEKINAVEEPLNDESIIAVDNIVSLDLKPTDIQAKSTADNGKYEGFGRAILSGGLGSAVKTSLFPRDGANFEIKVDSKTIKELTVSAKTTGIKGLSLDLNGSYDLVVYRKTGDDFKEVYRVDDYLYAGKSGIIEHKAPDKKLFLTEGEYKVGLAVKDTILNLKFNAKNYVSAKDVVIYDYDTAPDLIKETAVKEGNIITDVDKLYGQDLLPKDGETIVSKIIDSKNVSYIVNEKGTTIKGDYGQLEIKPDGSYKYVVNPDFKDYGKTDEFTYEIVGANEKSSQAKLSITVNSPIAEKNIEEYQDKVIDLDVKFTSQSEGSAFEPFTVKDWLSLDALPSVMTADLLKGSSSAGFKVENGTIKQITFNGESNTFVSGMSSRVDVKLLVFKQVIDQTGKPTDKWEQVVTNNKLYTIAPKVGLGGIGIGTYGKGEATYKFTEGTYKVVTSLNGTVSINVPATISATNVKVTRLDKPEVLKAEDKEQTKGNIFTKESGQIEPAKIVKINDTRVNFKDDISVFKITGKYGDLKLTANGNYEYEINKNKVKGDDLPYNQHETFNVITQLNNDQFKTFIYDIKLNTPVVKELLEADDVYGYKDTTDTLGSQYVYDDVTPLNKNNENEIEDKFGKLYSLDTAEVSLDKKASLKTKQDVKTKFDDSVVGKLLKVVDSIKDDKVNETKDEVKIANLLSDTKQNTDINLEKLLGKEESIKFVNSSSDIKEFDYSSSYNTLKNHDDDQHELPIM